MNELIFSAGFRFFEFTREGNYHTDNRGGAPQHFLAYLSEGRCRIVSEYGETDLDEGDVFYIPKHLPYQSYWCGQPAVRFFSYGFDFFPEAEQKRFVLQKIACGDALKQRVRAVPKVRTEVDSAVIGEFYTVLSLLLPQMKTEPIGRAETLCRQIQEQLYRTPEARTDEIARRCGISQTTLYAVCKEVTGKTPNRLRREYLAEKASLLLTTTGLSVQEISDRLGFSSTSYFRKILKAQINKTPREIRKESLPL